ncbi:MAG TPA: hypothetical protein VJK49_05165, partial [Candidatus Limnocylindrales bacterium]|nr:hypothetical protein [Candidatus Limnocylindrales bacterium]
ASERLDDPDHYFEAQLPPPATLELRNRRPGNGRPQRQVRLTPTLPDPKSPGNCPKSSEVHDIKSGRSHLPAT